MNAGGRASHEGDRSHERECSSFGLMRGGVMMMMVLCFLLFWDGVSLSLLISPLLCDQKK